MKTGRLMYTASTDWAYATGLSPETRPFLWYQDPSGKTHTFSSNRDFGEWKRTARVDYVYNWNDVIGELDKANTNSSFVSMIQWLLHKMPPDEIEIPSYTPIKFYQSLQSLGVPIRLSNNSETFFPERVLKTLSEIEKLSESQRCNEQAFFRARAILNEADIASDNTLFWKGTPLTSEILRAEMAVTLVRQGCQIGMPTMVSCAQQAGFPHERGHGPLRAHEFILIDCFPIGPSGYWGDMSRTFVKGRPSSWHQDVYHAVLSSMEFTFRQLKPGINGRDIHISLDSFFRKMNMPSGVDAGGNPYGWERMHGLGHSIGLDVHDPGAHTLNNADCILKSGMVTTVEPGLYYPTDVNGGVGGVRIEDMVTITDTGYTNLTTFPKDKWIID